jgi:hypothetical protein
MTAPREVGAILLGAFDGGALVSLVYEFRISDVAAFQM